MRRRVDAALALGQCDVAQPLEIEIEHAQVDHFLDQARHLVEELLLVRHVGKQHTDGERAVDGEPGAEIDGGDVLDAEDQIVRRLEADLQAAELDAGIDEAGIAVLPQAFALRFAAEQLDGLHGAHRLDEGRVRARVRLDLILGAPAQGADRRKAQRRVNDDRAERDEREQPAIDDHQHQCRDRHQAVDHNRDQAFGDEILDRLGGGKTRDQVADVAALEIGQRQPHQMMEQADHHLEADDIAELQRHERAQRGCGDIDEREQAEANRQRDKEPAIAFADRVVDRNLHVERADQDEQLHDHRKHERLGERAAELADPADHGADAQPLDLALFFEIRRRRQLECDAGHVLRQLVEVVRAQPYRRIVDRDLGAADRF